MILKIIILLILAGVATQLGGLTSFAIANNTGEINPPEWKGLVGGAVGLSLFVSILFCYRHVIL